MTEKEPYKLIDGVFVPSEAREVLSELLSFKINFHNMKNFSSEERFQKPDEHSNERLADLKDTKTKLMALVDEAEKSNSKIKINSKILVEFID